MNTLSYRCTDDNGLSFELLVDGQPLGERVSSTHAAIPYWIIETGLPHLTEAEPDVRMVAVCSCGEYGCGHTRCRVVRDGDVVLFYDFDLDIRTKGRGEVFEFARSNYDEVVSEIVRLASRERIGR